MGCTWHLMGFTTTDQGDLLIHCQVQPKASRNAIIGLHNDRLKIQITAAPTDGKANRHLIGFIAQTLGVAKSRVELECGTGSRLKTLRIKNLDTLPDNFFSH
jgi:uncharacterized protein (TIGR00251 family)